MKSVFAYLSGLLSGPPSVANKSEDAARIVGVPWLRAIEASGMTPTSVTFGGLAGNDGTTIFAGPAMQLLLQRDRGELFVDVSPPEVTDWQPAWLLACHLEPDLTEDRISQLGEQEFCALFARVAPKVAQLFADPSRLAAFRGFVAAYRAHSPASPAGNA